MRHFLKSFILVARMLQERLNQTQDFKENEAGPMANAWQIDADTALISPLKGKIEDSTFEAIAARAKMGEFIILSSTKDETWLSNKIASRLGPIIGNGEALGKILMQGKNFELRFEDANNVNYYELE